MLGHSGITLERDQVGRCGDNGRVGQNDDVEGPAPHCRAEPEGLSKGGDAEQASHAGGRSPPDPPSEMAPMGYYDLSGLNSMTQDILFEKSPKAALRPNVVPRRRTWASPSRR